MQASFATAHFGVFPEEMTPGRFVRVSEAGGCFGYKGIDVRWQGPTVPEPLIHRRLALIGWDSRERADGFLEQQLAAEEAFKGATEVHHLLLQPYRQHGAINWIDTERPGAIFETGDAPVGAREPVCVITSFGAPNDRESLERFAERMTEIMPQVHGAPGCRFATLMRPADMRVDGITFSCWDSEAAMRDWAYRGAMHADAMKMQQRAPMASRTSFTRFRTLRSERVAPQGTQTV